MIRDPIVRRAFQFAEVAYGQSFTVPETLTTSRNWSRSATLAFCMAALLSASANSSWREMTRISKRANALIPVAVAALEALNLNALRNAEAGELRQFAEHMHHWQQLVTGERQRRVSTT
jgi:hypothetical protein